MPVSNDIPVTMLAAVLDANTKDLHVERLPVPSPAPGEVLVRVSACGVCHSDLHVMNGDVAFPRPAVLGHEISGTVVGLGDDSLRFAVDDRVVGAFLMPCTECAACTSDRDDLCSNFFAHNRLNGTLYDGRSRLTKPDGSFLAMYSMGGLAEYCVIPASALALAPEGNDLEESCILGCAGLTSYGAVHHAGKVRPGSAVAVVGVGGVGSSLLQMVKSAGASCVIAIDVVDKKLEWALDLGATHTVNAATSDPVARVREITGGSGVDLAFEALGLPLTFGQATLMLADGGRMVAIGIAASGSKGEVEITPLVRRGISIAGSFGGRTRTDLPEVVRLASTGAFNVSALVAARYPLDRVNEAYQSLARGEITGKAIVVMPHAELVLP